jgi:adenylate kinase family enzyme
LNIFKYNRIIIVGNNGSGKSYLTKELSVITGLPLVHLDVEFWRPNWEKPEREEWIKMQTEFTSKEKWIIDGNHTDTMELRFQSADLIIFLDINRFTCLTGVLKRNGKKRSDMPNYLQERYDKEYIKFLKGLWNFSRTRKHKIMDLHKKYPDKAFFIIKSRRKLNALLKQWKQEKSN